VAVGSEERVLRTEGAARTGSAGAESSGRLNPDPKGNAAESGKDRFGPWEPPGGHGRLPRDVGWLLLLGGTVGFAAPGVLGLDMLALGALILWPGNARRIERWLAGHSPPKVLRGSLKQVNRFLEDLERRYPRTRE
jgi:hypothetical protein